MNRFLLIVTAALALTICGVARANYQYGSGLDDRFDRNRNDLRHFDDRDLFNRDWNSFRHPYDRWFDGNRDDLRYFNDHPFNINDLRYFDTGVIA
jgi:hypothetical protein